ncbi:hypothetical protein TPHA_0B00560 [Tetrapisispora phaffii CBS 4417]|uniref:Pre-rRNA-processing protein TSR2 n=1 Tax=Tetrapisispora phaffii (strain ATCC 24235 / CBS 4417 / NBRC 1672 / NRRL Y-8282 / UCD 70-5) TaxID=1071381 RepID=G8BQD1_TETPH|nr:hypothetical protein TPHA_0B00560 [Tetrapisispora phaffii CBS 4417]CCE61728.1 hypothetical protein TPHA_0B00560 [Tetrapisispora phaffii CBS 4417]
MSLQFDEAAFVEATNGKANLKFDDEKQQARFELGVSMMVYRWDALEIAVANKWGGPDSAEKRDWISGIIIDAFKTEKTIDVAYIEEMLLYAMTDEFDTNVEDDSALPIAAGIIELYKQADALDFSNIESLYLDYQNKQNNKSIDHGHHVHVTEDPLNPNVSSSEEDDDSEGEDDDEDMMEEDQNEPQNNIPEPIIDDDGFELIQKKGKNRY